LDGAHDAAADALAAARVLWRIGQRAAMPVDELAGLYAGRRRPLEVARSVARLASMSLADLHAAQVRWYAEQLEGLTAWWRQRATELEHQASTAPGGEAEDFLAEAADLRGRADGVCPGWPCRPFPAAVSS
jgi:DNA polymerase-3 subunit epsilon